jgi:excisionase family DNA binding protein
MATDPNTPAAPAVFRVPEAALYLQIARGQAYRMVAEGQLPVIRIGRSLRIPKASLDAWLAAQLKPASRPPTGRTGRA